MCLESDIKSFKLNLARKEEENSENNVMGVVQGVIHIHKAIQ